MTYKIRTAISAGLALIISIMSLIAGIRVLGDVFQPDYLIFRPLVVYNVLMGAVGLFAVYGIWTVRHWAAQLALFITKAHGFVLLVILLLWILNGFVALQSLGAMILRVTIWAAISWLIYRKGMMPE